MAGTEGWNAYFPVDRFIPFKTYGYGGSVIYRLTTWIHISADPFLGQGKSQHYLPQNNEAYLQGGI